MKYKKITAGAMAAVVAGMTLVGGCGSKIDADAVVATLDDKEITLGYANFVARYQQATYDSYYLAYMGDDMWSQDMTGSGETFEDSVKEEVMQSIEDSYVLDSYAEEYDVALSEEELAEIEEVAQNFIADNSDEAIEQIGATKEYVVEMLRLNQINSLMYDAIVAEVDTKVSDEEAAQRAISYVEIATDSYTDDDGNTVDYTDEEKETLAQDAKKFAKAAKKGFDEAAEDAGYEVQTDTYGSAEDDDATLDTAVLQAADELKEGETSGVVETDTALYVVTVTSDFDEEATETEKEEIVSERQEEYYEEVLAGFEAEVEWTVDEDVWATVTFDELFTTESDETSTDEDATADETTEGTTSDTSADETTEGQTSQAE
ncbi:peptidyl-prolyl cis-trans isomerase [Eubacterium oxidoreducens]|uniref:Foldase protein PrsA n=1 Tax=Eubacterium oxidoreducens TaxID=1732 RepID=A0A1G6BW71_EUBOX|nr:peptidyl-prolyl cis-trans isomerase [Eubacterium oxidoreducens]SDB24850.1 foldase protein PrsA [Eubacterium oxidoreducens]